ncbi:hypothetical protein ACROYT_G032370 [Oculina patagonica]
MHDSLYTYLNDNNLLYSRQSGFRKHHSTEIALIKIVDELLFNLDNDKVSGMVLVDYTKAFDMVDHELLLRKLEVYGVINKELVWCHSYLSNRQQVVQVGGEVSSEMHMAYGVPQGSILGPLFFLLFINDLPLHVSTQVDLYADDTTVCAAADVANLHLLNDSLNTSVGEIESWANANKLLLNEKKTKVLMITGNRLAPKTGVELCVKAGNGATALDNVSSATLLGLDIDSKLSFNEHVEKTYAATWKIGLGGGIGGVMLLIFVALAVYKFKKKKKFSSRSNNSDQLVSQEQQHNAGIEFYHEDPDSCSHQPGLYMPDAIFTRTVFEVDRYKVSSVEKGTPLTEEIEVDVKQDVEVFRVPAHNDVDAADFYHDFKMRVTVTKVLSRKVCYIANMDPSVSSPAKLKEDIARRFIMC